MNSDSSDMASMDDGSADSVPGVWTLTKYQVPTDGCHSRSQYAAKPLNPR